MSENKLTPIQIAIEELTKKLNRAIEYRKELPVSKAKLIVDGRIEALFFMHETLTELLPSEKEQLIEAYKEGQKFEGRDQEIWIQAEQYYTQTFKVNQ